MGEFVVLIPKFHSGLLCILDIFRINLTRSKFHLKNSFCDVRSNFLIFPLRIDSSNLYPIHLFPINSFNSTVGLFVLFHVKYTGGGVERIKFMNPSNC